MGAGPVTIRPATVHDLDDITRVYDTTIVDSPTSFDTEPWSRARREEWWADHQGHPRMVVLVAEEAGTVIGTSYSSWYRNKQAYDRSVETTIVLQPDRTGQGIGTSIYGRLLAELEAAGVHRAYAVVTLPNDASVALHHRMGFVDNGIQHEVGFKLGQWWSTLTLEKRF